MTTTSTSPRVAARQAATRERIVEAAWAVADELGLEGLSLREIAARVGMRAPSLYSYFPHKASILDALFAAGYQELGRRQAATAAELPAYADEHEQVARHLRAWIAFCQESPARYRLMFTSAVPGWTPSPEAYAASLASFGHMTAALAAVGITEPAAVDLVTSVGAGLAAQQMANDPAGDRWARLTDDAVTMLLAHLLDPSRPEVPR